MHCLTAPCVEAAICMVTKADWRCILGSWLGLSPGGSVWGPAKDAEGGSGGFCGGSGGLVVRCVPADLSRREGVEEIGLSGKRSLSISIMCRSSTTLVRCLLALFLFLLSAMMFRDLAEEERGLRVLNYAPGGSMVGLRGCASVLDLHEQLLTWPYAILLDTRERKCQNMVEERRYGNGLKLRTNYCNNTNCLFTVLVD
uniref:Uncharacterized protein n=1 Tax=Salmo trutta TaxID=8032 RepID=A0A673ZUZ3_SALTR